MEKLKESCFYGIKSLFCLVFGILSFFLYYLFLESNNEGLLGIFFYCGFIFEILSFIIGIVGLVKDKKKILSIICIIIVLLIMTRIIYFFIVELPRIAGAITKTIGIINN